MVPVTSRDSSTELRSDTFLVRSSFVSMCDVSAKMTLERARNTRDIPQGTTCIFTPHDHDTNSIDMEPDPSFDADEDPQGGLFSSTLSEDGINFSPWVNRVRLIQRPRAINLKLKRNNF